MAVCGALWLVLFTLGAFSLSKQSTANERLSALIEAQGYQKSAIDELKGDVRTNRDDIKALGDRVKAVEVRR